MADADTVSPLRGADPVWIAALDAHPTARAEVERLMANGQVTATGSLVERLIEVLWYATGRVEGPGLGVLASFAQHLRDALADRPTYAANELAAAIAAAVHGRFPDPFAGWDTAADCAPWRNPSALYLVVLWPSVETGPDATAWVSVYRVERHDDDHYDNDHELSLLADAPTVVNVVVWPNDAEAYFPRTRGNGGPYATAADARAATQHALVGVDGGFASFGRALAMRNPSVFDPTIGGDGDWGAGHRGDNDQRPPSMFDGGPEPPGAALVSKAMVSLVGVSPRLAGEVLERAASDLGGQQNPPASLVGVHAALVDECGLALALRLSAAQVAAQDLEPLTRVTSGMRSVPSLASTAAATIGRWRGVGAHSQVSALPDAARDAAAFATWQSVCSAAYDPLTGRLDGAERLVDVARALGVEPTPAQIRRPERLCPDLLDAAVRAGVRGNYPGVIPTTPNAVTSEDPVLRPPALELVAQTWEGSVDSPNVPGPPWRMACAVDPEARLAPAQVRLLLSALSEARDRPWAHARFFPVDEMAVMAEAERAAATGAPLLIEPDRRRGPDRSDALLALDPFIRLAVVLAETGAPVDPRDLVYPGRMCARLALYRALDLY
ncbi:hypothetical protein pdul_cds_616 [Pandoravirus dulcis]|uniref:Uncharacterized protein n=1 Tax=Pandoravirus dulcis TaxID=1349409 RepID=S4VR36_9VIRU|nr:hypothetical protein pdul_cds_616 [Pandoravirus dulcis]AGO82742.1 hypothetical protein pdul_cds_616 [Pandoravirus dulcis]